jgi:hypothetical protein
MAHTQPTGTVLPRPRIPNTVGVLNIIVATVLMLVSVYLAGYTALMPVSNRVMVELQRKAEADLEAKKQLDLKALDAADKAATSDEERQALRQKRQEIEARPKAEIPITMNLEKLGMADWKFVGFACVEVATAMLLHVLMLAAGIGLVRRQPWGIRLGIAAALAKIVRLVLVFGFAALVLVPLLAQGSGRVAWEMTVQQQATMGRGLPPAINAAFFTKIYYIMYTGLVVAMIVFGSIYPAITLWFLTRPGARAACSDEFRGYRALGGTRVLGIVNVVFASCLILFGLCLGAYITALPLLGRVMTQVQKKAEADFAARQQKDLEALAEDEKKATTAEEKTDIAEQRKAIEARPKPAIAGSVDFGQLGFDDPKVRIYYWIELGTGLLLNAAWIAAGIALVRRRPWGVSLGIGTAVAKIARLAVAYSYFALALAPTIATKTAGMVGRMMVQRQVMLGQAVPPEIDTSSLAGFYTSLYELIAAGMIVVGSIYPAIVLVLLLRAGSQGPGAKPKDTAPEPSETW